jgi:hypothetical protein
LAVKLCYRSNQNNFDFFAENIVNIINATQLSTNQFPNKDFLVFDPIAGILNLSVYYDKNKPPDNLQQEFKVKSPRISKYQQQVNISYFGQNEQDRSPANDLKPKDINY